MKKIRKLTLLLVLVFYGLTENSAVAQTYITFDISKGNVVFTSDRHFYGVDPNGNSISGTHNDANKYKITGSVVSVSDLVYDTAGVYTTSSVSNPYTVTIETINLVPTTDNGGNGNKGCTYDITLDNLSIDRSQVGEIDCWQYGWNEDPLGDNYNPETGTHTKTPDFGKALGAGLYTTSTDLKTRRWTVRGQYEDNRECSRPPFDAGDDTVDVLLTLVGTNVLKGESGANAALQYNRYDGAGTHGGEVGDGCLTIQGDGSLWAKKNGSQNAGAAIGAVDIGADDYSAASGKIVINSGTIIAETGGPYDYSTPIDDNTLPGSYHGIIGHPCQFGSYAAAIGGAACGRISQIIINGGNVTARSYATAAAIGCGGGYVSTGGGMISRINGVDIPSYIIINGGTVTTYNMGMMGSVESNETAVGIGGGSCNYNRGSNAGNPDDGPDNANIVITGGTVYSYKNANNDGTIAYVGGNIGGGNSNISKYIPPVFQLYWPYANVTKGNGGSANVKITGGTIFAENLGGGGASQDSTAGGHALLTIDMLNGSVNLTGNIGGGNSRYYHGGNATVHIVKGTLNVGSIGGGNSLGDATVEPPIPGDGDGGYSDIIVEGGNLVVAGKIGGGYSAGAGSGGNASIYVTGGTLDCGSIGGGDSNTGIPGSVSADVDTTTNPLGAGVYIAGSNKITVKSGYIGGGINTAGDIGKATAYINATHSESTLQGQFILTNTTSTATDHCFFIMEAGAFDNTDLGTGKYLRAKDEGGAVYMNDNNGEIEIKGGTISNSQGTLGGAIYMSNGTFSMSGGTIGADASDNGNKATEKGGAIYMAGGSFEMTGGSIKCNKALNNDGGGLYLNSGTVKVSGAEAAICGNEAKVHGGGIYVGGGSFTMTDGAIGGTTTEGNKTTGNTSYGGGLYMGGGTATITGGSISGNQTDNDGMGGGIYMDGGTCMLSSGATIGGASASYANSARHGGGIYSRNGSITVKGGIIDHNTAVDGGGIYSNGPDATVTIIKEGTTPSLLEYNQAVRGGGIFANRGVVDFTDGQVRQNYACEGGGGMYVNTEGTLNLKGSATLSGNHVPATGKGGGVYLDGTLNVGENAGDPIDRHSLKVDDNYAGTPSTPNNVYLHDMDDVVTLLSDISGKDSGCRTMMLTSSFAHSGKTFVFAEEIQYLRRAAGRRLFA